ncbi:MAG TPA: MFS transporter [Burkholderiales bacterium]
MNSPAEPTDERLAARLMLVVFCPFAAGYFLSYFFRNVNAVIARDLAIEFSLAPSDLGLLTATYFLAFAAFQLPLGVLLDRYGPRRVVAGLMLLAGTGALVFGLATNILWLTVGRALIGLGVAGGLMGAIKAFTLWFPPSRLATLNGLYIGVGGLGGLAATAPVEALLGPLGWRGLFFTLAALSVAAAITIFAVVPERRLPGQGESLARQAAAFRFIFGSQVFWRIALPMMATHAAYQALQGLWLAPWLYDVANLSRSEVARHLFFAAAAYAAGSVFFGVTTDRLASMGFARMSVYKTGLLLTLGAYACLAAGVTSQLLVIVSVYGFCSISAALAYALLTPRFPHGMAGRVNTAANVLMFGGSFAFQWGIGAVLRAYPVIDGRYAVEGYAAALLLLGIVQVAAIAWLLPMREAPAARSAGSA